MNQTGTITKLKKDMKTRTWNRTKSKPYISPPLRAAPDALTKQKNRTQKFQEGGGRAEAEWG